VYDFVACFSN